MPAVPNQTTIPITPTVASFAIRAGAIAMLASLLLVGLRYMVVEPPVGDFPPGDRAFVSLWDPPSTKLETMLDVGDGQAWAALGRDPTYSHPEVFYEGTTEFVYRSQRPLPGWVLWALSFGREELVGIALIAVTCAGMGVLVWASIRTAAAFRRRPEHGIFVGLLPGAVFTVLYLGPDLFLLGAALAGLCSWYRDTRRDRFIAIILLTAAALGRETLVLVPLVIAVHSIVITRVRWTACVPLATPALVLGLWLVSLNLRYGYWPSDADHLPRLAWPLVGIWEAWPHMDAVIWTSTLLGIGLVVLAFRRDNRSVLVWCMAAFIPVVLVSGAHVWALEPFRAFLPLFAFALLGALPRLPTTAVSLAGDQPGLAAR